MTVSYTHLTYHTHTPEKNSTVLIVENVDTTDDNSPKEKLTLEQKKIIEKLYKEVNSQIYITKVSLLKENRLLNLGPLIYKTDNRKPVSYTHLYNAYVAYKAKDALTEKLKETEMLDIYNNVEIPLTYALYDMEQAGIMVAGDKLKEYGEDVYKRQTVIYQNANQKL